MPIATTRNPETLFSDWKRRKDRVAGQQLAQAVADWYYALATNFAGEEFGAALADTACTLFGRQVVKLNADDELVGWAHGLIQKEMSRGGERAKGLNKPSVYSNARPPVDVLLYVKKELPEEMALLEAAYSTDMPTHKLTAMCTAGDGFPYALLRARYRVKKILRDHLSAPLAIIYDDPDRDLGPLPLYECGRLQRPAEIVKFEQWVFLRDELRQDLVEFAPFAIELRQGLPNRPPPASLSPISSPLSPRSIEPTQHTPRSTPTRSDTQTPFVFEQPMGRPAPHRSRTRPATRGGSSGSTFRVRVSIGFIIFSLALAFGLALLY
jgi:hypothetical protein